MPGVPLMAPVLPQDLKYTPSMGEMKYRPPENLSRSHFSTDNLMKANMYGDGERRYLQFNSQSFLFYFLKSSLIISDLLQAKRVKTITAIYQDRFLIVVVFHRRTQMRLPVL